MSHSIDQHISWYTMERFALGRLPEVDHEKITSHLATCDQCEHIHQAIKTDTRALPPLPTAPPVTQGGWEFLWGAGPRIAIAATAAIALVIVFFSVGQQQLTTTPALLTKGRDASITLLRSRNGAIVENPKAFAVEDRFKILVTCSLPGEHEWDVQVLQDGEYSQPYSVRPSIQCGNRVPLPGAFRLSGHVPAEICVHFADDTICTTLDTLE